VRGTALALTLPGVADQLLSSDELLAYVRRVSLREDDILRELREETAAYPAGRVMQVMAEEGQLLALLVGLAGARSVLEIGTFTGYSALWMARALPSDGELVTCDISHRWPDIGAAYWRRADVADRINVRIGDARVTLADLVAERGPASFDVIFIDADKQNYAKYYEWALTLITDKGLIIVDNTMMFGRVVDPAAQDPDTVAIREFNERLRNDTQIEMSLLPMADGITLIRKKPG
jgi:O-methyltransferase